MRAVKSSAIEERRQGPRLLTPVYSRPGQMTASQLAELNGLLALETARRADGGDRRDRDAIVDDILAEASAATAPIEPLLDRIAAMVGGR